MGTGEMEDWGIGNRSGRMAIGNCERGKRRQDEPHCHLLMMIIYGPEGLTEPPLPTTPARFPGSGSLEETISASACLGRGQIFAMAFYFPSQAKQIVYNIYCLFDVLRPLTMMKWQLGPKDPLPPSREISACDLTKGKEGRWTKDEGSGNPKLDVGMSGSRQRRQCSFPSTYFHFLSTFCPAFDSLAVCPRITSSWLRCPSARPCLA